MGVPLQLAGRLAGRLIVLCTLSAAVYRTNSLVELGSARSEARPHLRRLVRATLGRLYFMKRVRVQSGSYY